MLSLAPGIGANTTVFSVLDAVMLRLAAVENPERMVNIATIVNGGQPHLDFSYSLYTGLRDGNQTLSGVVAYTETNLGLAGDQTERIRAAKSSAQTIFQCLVFNLRWDPRALMMNDRAQRVAVISDALWHRRLAGDSGRQDNQSQRPHLFSRRCNAKTVLGTITRNAD